MSVDRGLPDGAEDPDELERRAKLIRSEREAAEIVRVLRAEIEAARHRVRVEAEEDAHRDASACPTPNERHLYDVADACHILGKISKQMLYRQIHLGQITPLKIGTRSVFDIEEIERFINVLRDKRASGTED